MGLKMSDVCYQISSDNAVSEIYIKGERAMVVSCTTQYITTSELAGTKLLSAAIYLESEQKSGNLPILHHISINEIFQEILYQ
ncbi:hypothetical protein [Liquorilactobacillus hordei]|uniref:Uncharacterized protein n=1 Tax=Liquorilactobacillus hordei TaxID=468911 RepID=A0A3Q8C9E0_9LACO|nr:hypothetical protein [Liquorilactobacillus hordei]AUJ29622.1 hypothetical protein BSQ49_05050 [Liquorilactobacillus hordei]